MAMTFAEAITSGLRSYAGFSGRAPRSEYWWWQLFVLLVAGAAAVTETLLGLVPNGYGENVGPLTAVVALALFLPNLAMAVRRLHDGNRSGWFILLGLIPIVGPIILLVWYLQRGTEGDNRFGPDPLAD